MPDTAETKAFIRVPWEEAVAILEDALELKYGAKGGIKLMKDYGTYDGVGDMYDLPTFVDVYFREP